MTRPLLILFFSLFVLVLHAQKTCDYSIDTLKANYTSNLYSILSKIDTTGFAISHNKKDIPALIKKELKCLGNGFTLANPGKKYDATDVYTGPNVPSRQLIFMATGKNFFMMTYNHGGIGWHQHIVLVQFENNRIIHLWTSQAIGDLNSATEVLYYIKQVKQGKVKRHLDDVYNHL